ncbi:MAG: Jag N-terminal domain-containing protein, partial [Oscillospiraceae bacterium]|nr:Jag N-terminal domain-containing protein [Oscillospiraceae bacterium]
MNPLKEIESTGRTVEEALESGLRELHCDISDVSWTTLQEGSKGLFGLFGSRPARVRITLKTDSDEDDAITSDILSALTKPVERRPEPVQHKPAPVPPVKPVEKVMERPPVKPVEKVMERPLAKPDAPSEKAADKPAPKPAPKTGADGAQGDQPIDLTRGPRRPYVPKQWSAPSRDNNNASGAQGHGAYPRRDSISRAHTAPDRQTIRTIPSQPYASAQPRRDGNRAGSGVPSTYSRPNNPRPYAADPEFEDGLSSLPLPPPPSEPPVIHPADTPMGVVQQYLTGLTERMGVDVKVYVSEDEERHITAKMIGDTLGILIGRRGETLDAIQYLCSLAVNKDREEYVRVTLDTENYRARREEALKRLAFRLAARAVKLGRRVALEPMNPYERRIMHSALQSFEGVTTHSEGEEPNRHVVISVKKNAGQGR